jgi:hypothetical protein
MRCRSIIVMFALGFAFATPLVFAQQFSSVEERMSSSDFKAAGLDKLSPEELARLNAFIRSEVDTRTAEAQVEGARAQDVNNAERMGFKDYSGHRDKITSRITGTFKGWTGGTTFTLDNGQVWRQSDSDSVLAGVHLENPVVDITPGLLGGVWYLQVQGYGSSAKVERVQ